MTAEEKSIPVKVDPEIEEMVRSGVHFGHKTSKTHPKMKSYIAGVRNAVHILNLEKTRTKLQEALEFIQKSRQEGKTLLLVGTKIQIRSLVRETAKECGLPYVTERWIGGTLTNFDFVAKRVARMKELEQMKASGDLEKYTKKEQAGFMKELGDLERRFGGVRDMERIPSIVFVCDMDKNAIAVREAKARGCVIMGITDTNINPDNVDYPIPANDDAVASVQYVLGKVKEIIKSTPMVQKTEA